MEKGVLSFTEHKEHKKELDYFEKLIKLDQNYVISDQGEIFRKIRDIWYFLPDSSGEDQQLCQDFGNKLDLVQQRSPKKII